MAGRVATLALGLCLACGSVVPPNQTIDAVPDNAPADMADDNCPAGYVTIAGSTSKYHNLANVMDWAGVRTACLAEGQAMITLDDQTEVDQLDTVFAPNSEPWIGLTDVVTEGVWLKDNGDPASFLPWGIGQPSNTNGNEHC